MKFYIKPQLVAAIVAALSVVSYWNSTSNHNLSVPRHRYSMLYLIEILHQTTTHSTFFCRRRWLYLIEILHQTTTVLAYEANFHGCILLKFYIKPQLSGIYEKFYQRCILLKFYIKPQHQRPDGDCPRVVSYWNSTSNHNRMERHGRRVLVVSYWNSTSNHNRLNTILSILSLYLIEILHQTTTRMSRWSIFLRCILLKFYIKPQRSCIWWLGQSVVSYWNSTSNHNYWRCCTCSAGLYLIEILHQTTTSAGSASTFSRLYLIEILHQTTTFGLPIMLSRLLYLIELLHQTTTPCTA